MICKKTIFIIFIMQELDEKEKLPELSSDVVSSKDGREHNAHATVTKRIIFWLYLLI